MANTSKPAEIMKEMKKRKAAGASVKELNKLRDKYMNSLTYKTSAKKKTTKKK